MIDLRNEQKRMESYNLTGPAMREVKGEYGYRVVRTGVVALNPATGSKAVEAKERALPGSITFAAGETKGDLPSAILKCPEIAAALAGGRLKRLK